MKRIAYLGLGVMGTGMASNLLKAGFDVTVWNRTREKCQPLAEQGAHVADTPAQAVIDAEVIMYCLSHEAAVEQVVFGEDGIMDGISDGQIAIDMSTVHPDTSVEENRNYVENGVEFLDAPVFGSRTEAEAGGLWVVVGGKKEVFDRVRPVFEPISESVHYMGETGQGAAMKLVGNLIVACQIEALGESLVLASKAGLDPALALDVIGRTDFQSPLLKSVGTQLLQRNFETHFALKHLYKDANLILELAEQLYSPAPALAAAREMVKAALNQGWGNENASAVIKELEQQAQVVVGVEQYA
jgi:3-hydroxyisobutyrate dehydrogenase-like beta-hydroxyacid dehydrogenase